MKIRNFLYMIFFWMGAGIIACSEDKGNYDYTSLNEVTIDSIATSYMREAGSNLYINPHISSLDEATADLSYSWTIEGEEI